MTSTETPREKFTRLNAELEADKKSGVVTHIDSTLNKLLEHVTRYPKVLPCEMSLANYLADINRQLESFWE
jgi:hypothetical protein